MKTRFVPLLRNETKYRDRNCARNAPAAAPTSVSARLSINNCRTSLARFAPIASRTAISRSLVLARASIKLARFEQAISNTNPAMPNNSSSGSSYSSRRSETPEPAGCASNL